MIFMIAVNDTIFYRCTTRTKQYAESYKHQKRIKIDECATQIDRCANKA